MPGLHAFSKSGLNVDYSPKLRVLLKSELSHIEICVTRIVNFNENLPAKAAGLAAVLSATLEKECSDLVRRLEQQLFGTHKDHVVRRYIQFHQAGIVTLSDQLFQAIRETKMPAVPARTRLLLQALQSIEGMLMRIAKRFYFCFDQQHPLSQFRADELTRRLRTKAELTGPLLVKHKIDPELREAFFCTLEQSLAVARYHGLSQMQATYLTALLELINEQLISPAAKMESLVETLYQHNFNSTYFEAWYREHYLRPLAVAGPVRLRPVRQEFAIEPSRKPLDVLLQDWLDGQSSRKPGAGLKLSAISGQLPLNLSVAQLALFVRLCYLEGCFRPTNISNIMRFFTAHFETKKQLHISLKSFSKFFYAADQGTAATVRDYLQRMILLIDKIYFPKT